MAGWVTLNPVSFNSGIGTPNPSAVPATVFGYDTGSPGGTFTAWGANNAILIPNNGQVVLMYWAGSTTAPGVTDVLVGQAVGTTAANLPAATVTTTIATSAYGWLGPWNPSTYNIVNIGANFGAVAGTPGALPAAAQGCVAIAFTTITQLAVRVMQILPA
jgi:hypothetical protein